MRAVLIRSLLVVAIGAVVLAGVLYVASTVDTRPPEVLEVALTQPVADDLRLAQITTSIEITFSEPVDPDSATDVVDLDPPVEGSDTWTGSTLIYTPGEPLELATEYTVTIATGLRDQAGNEMTEAPPPFTFATSGRPTLAASDPADGATDVPVDISIGLVFSGLMDTASVESALEISPPLSHDLRWSGENLEIVPEGPLEPGTDYTVRVGADATDASGVAIAEEVSVAFRTVAHGLQVESVLPAAGSDGISTRTPIAVTFDRAVDPDSIEAGLLTLSPDVAGTLEVVGLPGDPAGARTLRFALSAPLPPNTTVQVELGAGLRGEDGGRLAEPQTWSFTTGAPQPSLSNHVLFLSDRSGVTNLWAMNPDGTGQRQISAELQPILDYAVAPNGSSLVVGDGRRLVFLRADGSERQVLTDDAHLEFDPAYGPDAFHVTFARADAATGELLGLWRWEIGAGPATEVDMPRSTASDGSPSPGTSTESLTALRAPRYSPDTGALAFVDLDGRLGILELPGHRLTMVDAAIAGVPGWDARSSALLLRLQDGEGAGERTVTAPVAPLDTAEPAPPGIVRRSGTELSDADLGGRVLRFVGAPDGRIGWIDAEGAVHIAPGLGASGDMPEPLSGARVSELAFGPSEGVIVVVLGAPGEGGAIERVNLESGERTRLATDGWRVRWLP